MGFLELITSFVNSQTHFSHEISLFLTGLEHTEHGYCMGPGCKFMSLDSISRYLKYQ